MGDRESTNQVETRKETRSDEEKTAKSSGAKGERRTPRRRRIARKGRRRSSSKRGGNRRRRTNQPPGLSDTSNSITRRASKRPTRASIHLPHDYKGGNDVPAVPRRVFKALQLLRHEKFLRVVSKYLKPRFHGQ